MWQLFKKFCSYNDAHPLEGASGEVLKTQAAQLEAPPEQLLADLRDALALPNGGSCANQEGTGVGNTAVPATGDEASSVTPENFPEGDCINASELAQVLGGVKLVGERRKHFDSCTVCQALVACAQPSPDRVHSIAARLARPTESPEFERNRAERDELLRQQEKSFEIGISRKNDLEIVTPARLDWYEEGEAKHAAPTLDLRGYVAARERESVVIVTVVAKHHKISWYPGFTSKLKDALSFWMEFAPDNAPHAIEKPYFSEELHDCKPKECTFLHLFPFYQTRSRRAQGFEVLPYASLIRIGSLIHKEHPIWKRSSVEPACIHQPLQPSFFRSIIRCAVTSRGRIAFLRGSIFEELAEDVAEDLVIQGWASKREAISVVGQIWTGIDQDDQSSGYVAVPSLAKCRGGGRNIGTNDIVLYDNKAVREEDMGAWRDAGFVDVSLRHGLRIPVGIGMSMNLVPRIFGGDRWATILKEITPVLREYMPALEELGIDLDERLLADAGDADRSGAPTSVGENRERARLVSVCP